jgi:hypothetical protein
MDALAAFPLGDLYDAVPVQIRRRFSQIEGVWRAQRVLCAAIGIGVKRCYSDAVLCSCSADPSDGAISND